MKLAAVRALYELAQEPIPNEIQTYLGTVYPQDAKAGMFKPKDPLSPRYIIPKPFDPRVVPRVARSVARAAMETGVALVKIDDLGAYEKEVKKQIAHH